jgi:uncharacterized delta-60 repeat protein/uncharacterized repeat protein (TIGR01451 family)
MRNIFTFLLIYFLLGAKLFAQVPGSLDIDFNGGTGANDVVYYIEKYPGNRIVAAGKFSSINGTPAKNIVRLTPFGTIDPTFQVGTGPNGDIWVILVQPDGKILIGGDFTSFNGVPSGRIARLNQDGSLDQSFNAGTGANSWVYMLLRQNDGKILAGGTFIGFGGTNRNHIVRLNPNGSIDTTFNPKFNGKVSNGAIFPDGKIILGGTFTSHGQTPCNNICKVKNDGSLDSSFVIGSGASHEARTFAIQPDGKIIAGGYFLTYNGQPKRRIMRLNPNGSLDQSFLAGTNDAGPVYRVEHLLNGKILVMGNFSNFEGSGDSFLTMLNPDGTVDPTFNSGTGPNNAVQTSHTLGTGKIAIGGFFTSYNGILRSRIAVIYGDSALPVDTSTTTFIQGKVFVNKNGNCTQETGEKFQLYRILKAEPGPYWASTSGTGNYQILADTGNYTIKQVKSSLEQLLEVQYCPPNGADQTADLAQYGDTVTGVDFSNTIQECPLLKIEVSSNRRRRCFRNQTFISVSNFGTATSVQPKVYLKMPNLVHLLSASQNFTFNATDSVYEFQLDSILPNQMRVIQVIDSVACIPGVMGLEQCTQVWATPSNSCVLPNPSFDGVNLVVTGSCVGFVPKFKIKNTGPSMTSSRNYQVFSDSLLVESQPFLLAAGDSIEIAIIGSDPFAVVRLEAPQSQNHPFSSFASATAPCNFAPRPSDFFAQNDEDPITATSCMPILDSYDPNDKLVSPKGSTNQGNVLPGKYFTYTVRFQNTGNDTAYNVVVVDTLDPNLDPSSLELLGSSHNYSFSISGKGNPVLKWRFANILLPDSFVNVVASNGFLTFRVKAKQGTPLGTQIRNNADIYFDFNDPIRTNTTLNTLFVPTVTPGVIDSVQIVTSGKQVVENLFSVKIYPNPSKGKVFVESGQQKLTIRLFSVTGKEVFMAKEVTGPIEMGQIQKGLYHLEISGPGGKVFRKLILE